MTPMIASLWWARPDSSALTVTTTMFIAMMVNVLFAYSEVLHNSLLVRAAGLDAAHKASGLALSLGNFASVLALGFTAWAFALAGQSRLELGACDDRCSVSTLRRTNPSAWWHFFRPGILVLGAIPLFCSRRRAEDRRSGAARVPRWRGRPLGMIKTVRRYRDAVIYLLSQDVLRRRMNGVLFFFGVFAAGVDEVESRWISWSPESSSRYLRCWAGSSATGSTIAWDRRMRCGSKSSCRYWDSAPCWGWRPTRSSSSGHTIRPRMRRCGTDLSTRRCRSRVSC
jgi:hypothetical protein